MRRQRVGTETCTDSNDPNEGPPRLNLPTASDSRPSDETRGAASHAVLATTQQDSENREEAVSSKITHRSREHNHRRCAEWSRLR